MIGFRQFQDPVELGSRGDSVADSDAQGSLMNEGLVWHRGFKHHLALHPMANSQIQLRAREFGHTGREGGSRVVLRLKQAWDEQELHVLTEGGVVLQLGDVQEGCRQQTSVLLPPAASPIRRHDDEGIDERLIRAGVVRRKTTQALLTHTREA
ncbi:hypothetical protein STPH2_4910 [Streptomyces sp. KO7888]|nr:hypothetical protein STPH1_4668 [Streptomyces sp. OM5714]NHI09543.1 hypothetical protein [Streptomyces sp. KO7888]